MLVNNIVLVNTYTRLCVRYVFKRPFYGITVNYFLGTDQYTFSHMHTMRSVYLLAMSFDKKKIHVRFWSIRKTILYVLISLYLHKPYTSVTEITDKRN